MPTGVPVGGKGLRGDYQEVSIYEVVVLDALVAHPAPQEVSAAGHRRVVPETLM